MSSNIKDPRFRVQTARDVSNEFRDLVRTTTRPTRLSTSLIADEGFWMAVLPFKYTGSGADLKALAEGLSEEVITGLSRFSYLRVIARGSTAMHSSESGDVRAVGKELGAQLRAFARPWRATRTDPTPQQPCVPSRLANVAHRGIAPPVSMRLHRTLWLGEHANTLAVNGCLSH